jgi:hypothetical protein
VERRMSRVWPALSAVYGGRCLGLHGLVLRRGLHAQINGRRTTHKWSRAQDHAQLAVIHTTSIKASCVWSCARGARWLRCCLRVQRKNGEGGGSRGCGELDLLGLGVK